MAYRGTIAVIPAGRGGLNGNDNLLAVPSTDLQLAEGVTFENGVLRKMPGAALFDAAGVSGDPAILAGHDWWPDDETQRMVIACDDGCLYKEVGEDTDNTLLVSGMSTENRGVFTEAGAEATGAPRKLIYFDGAHTPKVVTADAAVAADMRVPPADWTGSNQPLAGIVHGNGLWAWGNLNAPHQVYRSDTADHEDFQSSQAMSLTVYPGVGKRMMCGLEHDQKLFLFKWPKGIYALDDVTDTRPTYWTFLPVTSLLGVAASPFAALEVPGDILFLSSGCRFYLLSQILKSPDKEGIRAADLSEKLKIATWLQEHINRARLDQVQSVWFEEKSLAIFTLPKAELTTNTVKLFFDFSHYEENGTVLFSYDYRDECNALWMRQDENTVARPVAGNSTGKVYLLDQAARVKGAAAYQSTYRSVETDFDYLQNAQGASQGLGSRKKNFDFFELVANPKGPCALTLTTYLDGTAREIKTLDPNRRTHKVRIRGEAQYFSYQIDHDRANEDFSIVAAKVYMRPGREVPSGSGGDETAAPEVTIVANVQRGYKAVSAGAVSVTITNASATGAYVPTVTPSWNTKAWESSHLEGQFTFTFDTPAPAGAYVRWTMTPDDAEYIPAETGYYEDELVVSEDATTATVTHPALTSDCKPNLQPSWNTEVTITAREAGSFDVAFSVPAPADATLDWSVIV